MTGLKDVGLVILGAGGYMGKNAIKAFPNLVKRLSREKIHPRILCLVEPNSEKWSRVKEVCNAQFEHIPLITCTFEDFLYFLEIFPNDRSKKFPIIVYDASPSYLHYNHMAKTFENGAERIFYLGEKPLFVDPNQIKHARTSLLDCKFFCELIETQNPVFRSVRKYLNENKLKINKMWFWRAGSSGIKKAIGAGRPGVQGGALIDKSLHDFSITLGLLGLDDIQKGIVIDATIHYFIIAKEYFERGNRLFLNASNRSDSEIKTDLEHRDRLSADGLFSTSVNWVRKDESEVQVDYLFSWVGFTGHCREEKMHTKEKEFVDKLDELGLGEEKWLLSYEQPSDSLPSDSKYTCRVEEVRIGIIEGEGITIVCNFLSKKDYGELKRYAYAIRRNGGCELIYEDPEVCGKSKIKEEDLSAIFCTVIENCLDMENAKFIGREASLLIHEVMFEAQDKAFRKFGKPIHSQEWFERSVPIFCCRIRPI